MYVQPLGRAVGRAQPSGFSGQVSWTGEAIGYTQHLYRAANFAFLQGSRTVFMAGIAS